MINTVYDAINLINSRLPNKKISRINEFSDIFIIVMDSEDDYFLYKNNGKLEVRDFLDVIDYVSSLNEEELCKKHMTLKTVN